jgi:hypothetical protein
MIVFDEGVAEQQTLPVRLQAGTLSVSTVVQGLNVTMALTPTRSGTSVSMAGTLKANYQDAIRIGGTIQVTRQ